MGKCHRASQKWRIVKRTLVGKSVSGSFKMACTGTAIIGDMNGEEWQWQTGLWLHKERTL